MRCAQLHLQNIFLASTEETIWGKGQWRSSEDLVKEVAAEGQKTRAPSQSGKPRTGSAALQHEGDPWWWHNSQVLVARR